MAGQATGVGQVRGRTEPGALVELEVAALLEATGEGFAHPPLRAGPAAGVGEDRPRFH